MPIADIIAATPHPNTRQTLARDLRALGVHEGSTLIVHSSLRAMGWVIGGPVAVIQALMDVLTTRGTLVMPAHSSDLSDPEPWQNPPVPSEFWPLIREQMPAFDPHLTPTQGIGRIAELFRTFPGVRRSYHPTLSFAAWGQHAGQIVADHSLDFGLGERSPLARISECDGFVLLLGVGHDRNTSLHLAQYRAPGAKQVACGSPILEADRRVWKTYYDIDLDTDPFPALGAEFEQQEPVTIGQVGLAEARLFSQKSAVEFATKWLSRVHE